MLPWRGLGRAVEQKTATEAQEGCVGGPKALDIVRDCRIYT